MTGRELISWIEGNDALDLEIMADCGEKIAGCTATREIYPEIFDTAGRGMVGKDGAIYTVLTGDKADEEVVVL